MQISDKHLVNCKLVDVIDAEKNDIHSTIGT
jgi:hypothetical protein